MTEDAATRAAGLGGSTDTAQGRLRILHVVVQAGPTNSQWNEHCLPVADERRLVVCSLLPATIPSDPRIERFEGNGSKRGALAVLRRALRRGGYDVVNVHAASSAVLLLLACVLERRGRDDLVFTLHTSWPLLRFRNRLLALVVLAAFPHVVACGTASAESIPGPVRRRLGSRLHVVPNGLDVDRVDRALSTPLPDHLVPAGADFVFITVGRLIPVKDHATLLRAFARMAAPHDRLIVVGDGPLHGRLENLARRLDIRDRVDFLGLVPRDDVYRLLARADVFVSPSLGEGLPVSVLEAMAAELPVVLSDIAPHREIADAHHGTNLAPVGDVRGLAAAMYRLRTTTTQSLIAMGAGCRRTVVQHFSIHSMSSGYHDVYEGVAAACVSSNVSSDAARENS